MRRPTLQECRSLLATCPPDELPALLRTLTQDPRAGVRALAETHSRRVQRAAAENDRLLALAARQRALRDSGVTAVVGVDEVGRGSLAGPVTAGAVILDPDVLIEGLDDSKRLPPHRREVVSALVWERAVAVCVAHAGPDEIDAIGIAGAVRLAMERAVHGLGCPVDHVLVDGNDARLPFPTTAVVGGDGTCACIAAASVVAKVRRDALMVELDTVHPGYGLAVNKGYSTPEHLDTLRRLGPSGIHRLSFAPCSQPGLF